MKRYRLIGLLKKLLGRTRYLEWRNAWLFGKEEDPVMLQELPEIRLGWPVADGAESRGPVFIISPTQRSGSNYLHQLIARHPGLVAAGGRDGLPEEFFFHTYGAAMKAYVEKTVAAWSTWITDEEGLDAAAHHLFASIGDGILSGLVPGASPQKLLLRAPDSRGIAHIFHLFPKAKVVLLFRDGRDTAASFLNSWGSGSVFADFARRWSGRTIEMIEFQERALQSGFGKQIMRVKYEDCVRQPEDTVREILNFLLLPEHDYPFGQLENIPLLGTSQNETVHWRPENKPEDFNPLDRWKKWSDDEKNTFHQIAGEALKALGYQE